MNASINIIIYAAGIDPEVWPAVMREVLPRASMRVWQEGDHAPADYALVWKPPATMLRGRRDLKAIFVLGAGVDAILQLGDALPAQVPLIRVEDAGMGMQMAEYVCQSVLTYFRRLDDYSRLQAQQTWQVLKPNKKSEFSIGVLGLGALGQKIIQSLHHFGFPLNGWSRTLKELDGVQCYAGDAQLDAFLRASRVLVVILPLTEQTTDLLNYARLSQLPKGAYLINVARGAHVVDDDLLRLIQEQHIAGATLDVFRQEPLPATHGFWQEPRISITPHISALTVREETAQQIAQKINAIEAGTPLSEIAGVVDRQRGY
ncbi:MAG: glyoxylate/hydroxypyruvate reductase A [Burkholderiaceae bacterium]|nr:glyoxylate/hydroxypyruvate reductase A [Burkholderiaceae bacterium]